MYVFNFHCVEPELTRPRRKNITITTQGLRRFIQVLRWIGLEPVSITDVIIAGGAEHLPASAALLTFDDGYENFYRHAAPVLLEMNCPATVFVLPGRFGGTNEWDFADLPEHRRDRLMTLAQMRELGETGLVTLGSHGLYHRHLPHITEEELESELHLSHQILSREIPEGYVPVFAYPWGEYSDSVLVRMMSSPYLYAFTTQKGPWFGSENPYAIRRYPTCFEDANPMFLLARLMRNGIGRFRLHRPAAALRV